MNAELLEALANFDTGADAPPTASSILGTRIRYGGRTRQCVAFGDLVEGQQFYVNPRDDSYLTRSSRPLSRCVRFAHTLVWVIV